MLLAVLLYTGAEVSRRRRPAFVLLGCGIAAYLTGLAVALSTVFFT
jgi:hypothetical protein